MARDFVPGTDRITITDSASLGITEALTIHAWAQTDSVAVAAFTIIDRRRVSDGVGGYILDIAGDGSKACALFYCYINGAWRSATSAYTMTTTGWWGLAGTYDKSNMYGYINGVPGSANPQTLSINNPPCSVTIGISPDLVYNKYDGRIAEVAIWNVRLTDAELVALSKGVPATRFRPNNLALYMPLWGFSTEPDLSGNKNNGTVTGTTVYNHAPVGRYAPWVHRLPSHNLHTEYINITDSGVGADALILQEWITITDTAEGVDRAFLLGEVLVDGTRLEHALTIRVSEPSVIASKSRSSGLPKRIYLGKQGRTIEIAGWVATIAELNTLTALADGVAHKVQLPTGDRVSVHITDASPDRTVVTPNEYHYTIRAVERMD